MKLAWPIILGVVLIFGVIFYNIATVGVDYLTWENILDIIYPIAIIEVIIIGAQRGYGGGNDSDDE